MDNWIQRQEAINEVMERGNLGKTQFEALFNIAIELLPHKADAFLGNAGRTKSLGSLTIKLERAVNQLGIRDPRVLEIYQDVKHLYSSIAQRRQ